MTETATASERNPQAHFTAVPTHPPGVVLATRPITVLLIDDQAIVGESVRHMLAPESDIVFHYCQDPSKAIDTANAVQPTVILQDLVMPDIDGLQLVKFFRANKATRETPMIVLSSKEEPTIKAQAFALGANDYLVKLPDRIEILARIRYHSQAYISRLERDEAFRQLEENQRQLAEEVAQAARYVQSLLPEKTTTCGVQVDWRFVPSTALGGDMFGYHWLDPEHLAIYLLDVSGHGVGSSLLAVSATNLLSARSLPDTDFCNPGEVLSRLNDVFQMEKQNGKYFTMWYGVYEPPTRSLAFSNAGHPPALLYNGPSAAEAQLEKLESDGLAIGMIDGMPYSTTTVALDTFARLLVYSDGVYEIQKPDGNMWQHADFANFISGLRAEGEAVGDRLLAHVQELGGTTILEDDFSVLEIQF
ncbi:MAG TPA: fused response regulator/phosphatase [Pirellulales bacterium]|jgi:sigma-B regulation protein RsbU (phosphoserine phosphatase)